MDLKKIKKQETEINFKKIVLTIIAVTGLVGVAVLAPNVLQVARQFSGNKKYNRKDYANRAINNLLKKDLIKLESNGKAKFFKLTQKGEELLGKYELKDFKIEKPRKWDKKWRVVIFDIKEKNHERYFKVYFKQTRFC